MKKTFWTALMVYAGMICLFAFLDLVGVKGDTEAWLRVFARPLHLTATAAIALAGTVPVFLLSGLGKRARG